MNTFIKFFLGILLLGYSQIHAQCDVSTAAVYVANGLVIDVYPVGNPPFSYTWSTGSNNSYEIVNTPGTYCVTMTDNYGCTDTSCYEYFYTSNCQTQIFEYQVLGLNGLIASPIGTPPYTYQWDTSPADTMQILSVDSTGIYCVTVTSSDGCVATNCYFYNEGQTTSCSVTIEQSPIPVFPATLYANGNNSNAPASFSWNTGDTGNFIHVTEPGFYCVTANFDNGCTVQDCYYFDTAGTNISCLAGFLKYYNPEFFPNMIYLINVSHGDSLDYLWEFGDGSTSNQAYPTHTYSTYGKYEVKLTVSYMNNVDTCVSWFIDSLGLDAYGNLLRSGFTINVVNEPPDLNLATVDDIQNSSSIKVYPNPFYENVKVAISSNQNEFISISIVDLLGNLLRVEQKHVQSGNNLIDLNMLELNAGVYLIDIQGNDQHWVQKIIKE